MSSTILKFYNTISGEDKMIIDSNALVEKKLKEVSVRAKKKPARPADETENMVTSENAEAGFVEGINADQIDALMMDGDDESNVIKYVSPEEEAEELRIAAQAKADEIVATAEQLAQEYKNNSRREAEIEGTRIKADAKQAGYQEGLVQAQEEYASRMQELEMRSQQMEAEYAQLIAELEPRFVQTITGIYEHIFKVDLSQHKELLAELIATTIHGVEGSRAYIVHVSAEDYPEMDDSKKAILQEAAPGCQIDIIQDIGLGRNQCLLETDNGVFDCGLDRQLNELRNKLMLLSYNPES